MVLNASATASTMGTSMRCPRPVRSRAMRAMTIDVAPNSPAKFDAVGTGVNSGTVRSVTVAILGPVGSQCSRRGRYPAAADWTTPSHPGTARAASCDPNPGNEQ